MSTDEHNGVHPDHAQAAEELHWCLVIIFEVAVVAALAWAAWAYRPAGAIAVAMGCAFYLGWLFGRRDGIKGERKRISKRIDQHFGRAG